MFSDYLTAFGFHSIETEEALSDFCHRVVREGAMTQIPDSEMKLSRWEVDEDIQIWMYINPGNEVESMIPVYTSAGTHRFRFKRHMPSETDRGRDRVLGWLVYRQESGGGTDLATLQGGSPQVPGGLDESDNAFQMLFLGVDAPLYPDELQSKEEKSVSIYASARKPNLYDNREAFREEQESWMAGVEISARCFIPSGMIDLSAGLPEETGEYSPYAYITGTIRSCHVERNDQTEGAFYHLTVQTHGVLLDVLLGPETVNKPPEPENIIEGHFFVMGLLHERPSIAGFS